MAADSGFAEVNGTRLHYSVAGSGDPLVLIHGFSLDLRMWDDQVEPFARHYRVIRYDMRGFGQSDVPDGQRYGHEADLRALLAYLGVERAHVIGLSLGGTVAIDYALTYPDLVRSLVSVDGFFAGRRFSQEWDSSMDRIWEIAKETGITAAKQAWLDHPLFRPARENPAVDTRLTQMINEYSGWHFVNKNPARSPEPRAAHRLEQVAAPSLIVVGERDLSDFLDSADEMAQHIPNARKIVMSGVGHMSNMEAPDRVNGAILEFLTALE